MYQVFSVYQPDALDRSCRVLNPYSYAVVSDGAMARPCFELSDAKGKGLCTSHCIACCLLFSEAATCSVPELKRWSFCTGHADPWPRTADMRQMAMVPITCLL